VLGAVTLFVHLPDVVRRPLPELEPLTDDLAEAMTGLASSFRTGAPAPKLVVRRAHVAFARAIDGRRQRAAEPEASDVAAVITETDLMVDSVDGMAELLASRR
jgi:hypothetical protein